MSGGTPDNNNQCDKAHRPPPSSLECSKAHTITLISIIDATLCIPINARHQIKPYEVELPPTLPCRVLKLSKDKMLNYGHDNDIYLSPFDEDRIAEEV